MCRKIQTSYIIIFNHYLPLCRCHIRDVNPLFIQCAYDAHITHSCTSIIGCRQQFFFSFFDRRQPYCMNNKNTGVSFKLMCFMLRQWDILKRYHAIMLIMISDTFAFSVGKARHHDSCRRMWRMVDVAHIWNVQLKSLLATCSSSGTRGHAGFDRV